MRSIAGKLYQRVNLLTLSLLLAISGMGAAVPVFLAQTASAITQPNYAAFDGVGITPVGTNSYTISSDITATDIGNNTVKLTGDAPIVTPWFGQNWTTYNYVTVGFKSPVAFTGATVYQEGVMRYDNGQPDGYYKIASIGDGVTNLATAGAAAGYFDFSFAANSPNTKKDGLVKVMITWKNGDAPLYYTIDITDLHLLTPAETAAPRVAITSPTLNQAISGRTVTVKGTATDTDFNYYYCYVSNVNGHEYGVRDASCTTTWHAVTPAGLLGSVTLPNDLPDGNYVVHLIGYDKAGNSAEATKQFVLDNTAPSANITSPLIGGYVRGTIDITGTFSDNNHEFNSIYMGFTGNDKNGNQLSWCHSEAPGFGIADGTRTCSFDTTKLSDGSHKIEIWAMDKAGNWGTGSNQSINVMVDNTAPTANFTFPTPGPTSKSFEVQFSEAVNQTDAENSANYFLNNWPGAVGSGTLNSHTNVSYDTATKTATVTFTTSGWSISAEQQWGVENIHDLAGNLLATNPTTAYSTPLVNPTVPGTPGAATPTNNTTVVWSWSPATDPGGVNASGVKGYYYTLTSGATTVIGSTFTSNPTATTTVPADGTYILNVYTIDNAGNVSGTVSGQVIVDTIAPVVTIDASANTANNKPTITGTIDDHTATVSLDIDGTSFVATNNGNGTWAYTATTALTDGTHNLTATGTDTAGNTTTPVAAGSILVDTTGPAVIIAGITAPITTGSVTPAVTAADVSAPLTYLWTANPTNTAVISFTNNIAQPIFTPTVAGTYSFTLVTTDALGNQTSKTFGFIYTPQPTNNNLGAPAVLGAQTTDTTQTPVADALGAPDVKGASTQLATTTKPSSSSTGLAWYWWVLIVAAVVSFIWWLIARLRNKTNVA